MQEVVSGSLVLWPRQLRKNRGYLLGIVHSIRGRFARVEQVPCGTKHTVYLAQTVLLACPTRPMAH